MENELELCINCEGLKKHIEITRIHALKHEKLRFMGPYLQTRHVLLSLPMGTDRLGTASNVANAALFVPKYERLNDKGHIH